MTAAIRVQGLVKTYAGVRAVDEVDLQVDEGEIFALLGPNGAGKTTTVEILEGYRRRDGGEVSVLGEDPQHADRGWRSRIGIVLQTSQESAQLTVAEMVRHFAGYYPTPRDAEQVIESVGLTGKRDARLQTLSGGQRRRLDVALGIIGNPRLLFLDEPTTGFDPQARRSFWDLIDTLRDGGTTILLTTHYLDEAEHLADRVGVINAGRLMAVDTPERLGGPAAQIPCVSWQAGDGTTRTERTTEPTALIARLSEQFAGEVPELQVVRPSLEEVYLSMIGTLDAAPVPHPHTATEVAR